MEGAVGVCCKKMRQAQTKLPRTAATEIQALSVRQGRVAIMMTKADASGRRRATQGSMEVMPGIILSSRSGVAQRGTPQLK
jgi:hypothetical protein